MCLFMIEIVFLFFSPKELYSASISLSSGTRTMHSREDTQTLVALQDMENRFQSELRAKTARIQQLEKQ